MEKSDQYQLIVEDIHLSFGGLKALSGVSTGVKKGEIFSVIGPNGAGKTCLLNCINSFYQPQKAGLYLKVPISPVSGPTGLPPWALRELFKMSSFSRI